MTRSPAYLLLMGGLLCYVSLAGAESVAGLPWARHAIDDTSEGADGVRPADVNGDGLPDFAVPWEEGGVIRVYLHPGLESVRDPWPQVTVGAMASPEDAVFADADGDGAIDVISAAEGDTKSLFVHWAPRDPAAYLDAPAWETTAIPASHGKTRWMYVLPRQSAEGKLEFVAGSKMPHATIGVFHLPEDPRDVAKWTYTPLAEASWIMTLAQAGLTDDGFTDLLYSDRKDPATRGIWLVDQGERTLLGGQAHEVMFLGTGSLDADAPPAVVGATLDNGFLRLDRKGSAWEESVIPMPGGCGTGKGVGIGDVDGDGRADIVFSCEHAEGKHGVVYLSRDDTGAWKAHAIAGLEGTKFDQVQLLDLDGDGDLDMVTCEEIEGLGVIWYENPLL